MTAKDIVERWLGSELGESPLRLAKAQAAAARCKVPWADVITEADRYRAAHPPKDPLSESP